MYASKEAMIDDLLTFMRENNELLRKQNKKLKAINDQLKEFLKKEDQNETES